MAQISFLGSALRLLLGEVEEQVFQGVRGHQLVRLRGGDGGEGLQCLCEGRLCEGCGLWRSWRGRVMMTISLRMMGAEQEHEQAVIGALADVDAVAVLIQHRFLGAVDGAIEGDIDEALAGLGEGGLPGGGKALRARRAAEAIAAGDRHADRAGGGGDGASIGQLLDETLLHRRLPAIGPGLAGDGKPLEIIGIKAMGIERRRLGLGLDGGEMGGVGDGHEIGITYLVMCRTGVCWVVWRISGVCADLAVTVRCERGMMASASHFQQETDDGQGSGKIQQGNPQAQEGSAEEGESGPALDEVILLSRKRDGRSACGIVYS